MLSTQLHPNWYRLEPATPLDQRFTAKKKDTEELIRYIRKEIPNGRFSEQQMKELPALQGNLLHCYERGVNLEYAVSEKYKRTLRDKLVKCNLIEFHPGACFGESAYYTSKLKPLPLLFDLPNPLIRITTADPKTGKESQVRGEDPQMMDRLYRYNKTMTGHIVTDGNGNQLATNLYRCHKVVNGHEYKGRFQQSSYQRMPKSERNLIRINGKPVCRIDVSGSHPQILYHQARMPMPKDAPYGIFQGNPQLKPIAKLAMLMMLNAKSRKGAITALQNKLASQVQEFATELALMKQQGIKFSQILDELEKLNGPIANHFYTQPCHHLMEIEADIIFKTIEILANGKNVPALQVYDEIIVPADKKQLAKKALELVWEKHLGLTPRVS